MTTKVTVKNDNLGGGFGIVVTEVDELGDPGTKHILPAVSEKEFWIHGNVSLKVEEGDQSKSDESDEGSDAGEDSAPVDARDDEEKTA